VRIRGRTAAPQHARRALADEPGLVLRPSYDSGPHGLCRGGLGSGQRLRDYLWEAGFSASQVCEVVVGYAAVDDVGRAINPLILDGQTHGGIAQGVGQALLENSYYDLQSGQLLAASFMDYGMPRADTLPFLDTELSEVPSPTNRLGVCSGGEGGTTPALAAVINAIVDALAELGVRHIEMPATPERVWRAMRAAAARRK
jgi:hypothetical protein